MGAPHLSRQMEKDILETYSDLKLRLKYEPSAKQVLNALPNHLKQKDYTESDIPKLRTIQDRLKRVRKRKRDAQGSSGVDETRAWNILTLNTFILPPESVPFVLQQWRYSISLDVVFTIRQAKWVSRLYPLFEGKEEAELWFASLRYTNEEELFSMYDGPTYRNQLDSHLIMGDWERYTAEWIDEAKGQLFSFYHTMAPTARDGGIAEECINALPSFDFDYNDPDPEKLDLEREISRLVKELPASSKVFPDFETRMVYLRHLSYIAKMPKWNTLEPTEIIDIILKLRKLVLDLKQDIEREKTRAISEDSSGEEWHSDDFAVLYGPHLKVRGTLFDIYKRAGYIGKGGDQ